jgi:hypothetical protein
MNITRNKAISLYKAISDPIIDLRVENSSSFSIEEMDEKLFELEKEIAERVRVALNLKKNW